MILQICKELREEINIYGCYFMSLLFIVVKYTNMTLTPGRINQLYSMFVKKGWMTETCFILDPVSILGWSGIQASMVMRGPDDAPHRVPPEYRSLRDEEEILFWKNGQRMGHFTNGDGRSHLTYDPYGISNSAKYGQVVNKRVFHILNVARKAA